MIALTRAVDVSLIIVFAIAYSVSAQRTGWTATSAKPTTRRSEESRSEEMSARERINGGTIGLAAELLEGAPIRLTTEVARVVDTGSDLQLLAIVTRGATELLYLKGVDVAIINGDALEEYKSHAREIRPRTTCLLNLFPSRLHILLRPEIKILADLTGKEVNFNALGTAAACGGLLIFSRPGIDVEKTFVPYPIAIEQMKPGEGDIAAIVFITSKPVAAFVKGNWPEGFKLLAVPYDSTLQDDDLPSSLQSADCSNLIARDRPIARIAVPTILALCNRPLNSPRHLRLARLTDQLFGSMDRLRACGFDAQWKETDIKTQAPGLDRFRAAREWLNRSVLAQQSARR